MIYKKTKKKNKKKFIKYNDRNVLLLTLFINHDQF